MDPVTGSRLPDWEAFYRDYRLPGYVAGFELTTKLGGGAFGLVFRARRMSIGKDYAIKFLKVDDGEVRRAVLAELEQVKWFAQIDHPNLVSIEDRGEVDGIPFLVMAFAGTATLKDKMPSRVPTAAEKDELLRWFLQSCRGLSALHERSLVHFDIKPANVFLKGSVARLGDYGLSKLVTHSRGSLSMGRGTPYYMAPELLQRRGDQRSDIYSLGVMLYELLCGVVPFRGDSEWEVLKQHETAAVVLPPHLTATERAVLQRCLQKDPAARFQSVTDLLAAFGAGASAGASLWGDLREPVPDPASAPGPGLAAAEPPPLPGASPEAAPAPPPTDALAGLAQAGREAMRHASELAQHATKNAERIARQAADAANRALRGLGPHDGAWRRLRASLRQGFLARRRPVAPASAATARPPRPAPPRFAWFWPRRRRVAPWVVMVLLVLAGLVLVPVRVAPVPRPAAASTAAEADGDRQQTYRYFVLPPAFHGHVSVSEPAWAMLAERQSDRARQELLRHIERLRSIAPLSVAARRRLAETPSFQLGAQDAKQGAAIQAELAALAAGGARASAAAQRLVRQAPQAMAQAAAQLAEIDWTQSAQVDRGRRLHEWLQATTGCRDLEFADPDEYPAATVVAANRTLGAMWSWFVNEFAHTPRSWRTFTQLLPPR
jgi:serine/threonine-protein kinase